MNQRNILDLHSLVKDLQKLGSKDKAQVLARFFKTDKGQYGEGDIFLGITVPKQRIVAKKYQNLTLSEVEKLMQSKIHEHRLTALLILVQQFKKGSEETRKKLVDFYIKNTKYINNWDLVDLSANHILGAYLLDKDASPLTKLSRSRNIWERRIAIIATFAFIYENRFDQTLKIAKILLNDKHDLIQKAVGWMLREVGKRDQKAEEEFLKKYYQTMPRTMLRYALERFDKKKRKFYSERKNSGIHAGNEANFEQGRENSGL